jgi:hypothetical protein
MDAGGGYAPLLYATQFLAEFPREAGASPWRLSPAEKRAFRRGLGVLETLCDRAGMLPAGAATEAGPSATSAIDPGASAGRATRRAVVLARLLVTMRDNPGLSERDLAARAGVPASTFRAWPEYKRARDQEKGLAPPRGRRLRDRRIEAETPARRDGRGHLRPDHDE